MRTSTRLCRGRLRSARNARACRVMVVSNKLTTRASRAIGRTREASAKTDEVRVDAFRDIGRAGRGVRACRRRT